MGTLAYMDPETSEMSTREVRAHLADALNEAAVRNRITYITQRGRRVAAIVPVSIAEQAEKSSQD